jgi:hypothetical protein
MKIDRAFVVSVLIGLSLLAVIFMAAVEKIELRRMLSDNSKFSKGNTFQSQGKNEVNLHPEIFVQEFETSECGTSFRIVK